MAKEMTKEEAIIHLDYLKDFKTPAQVEALNTAIEALKKEPCEDATLQEIFCTGCEYKEQQPCPYWDYGLKTCRHANIGALATKPYGDAVSRVEVIDELNRLGRNAFKEDTDYDNFFSFLDGLPPVTPIRPKGEWKYDKTIQNWRCSKCNETPKTLGFVGTKEFMTEHFKFCNHCGADMRGEKE